MTLVDLAGLAIAAFCAYEICRSVTNQETVIPSSSVRVSKAEQPVLYGIALGAWGTFMIAGLLIAGDLL